MKIVFLSNYFNHHQKFLTEALYKYTFGEFVFISTREMSEERKKLGWQIEEPEYVIHAYNDKNLNDVKYLIDDADIVIFGSAPEKLIKSRIRKGKIVFRYTERPFKSRKPFYKHVFLCMKLFLRNINKKNVFLLCASAFTYNDYNRLKLFENRAYKWGYFPKTDHLETNILNKERKYILWCGRLIDGKNAKHAIELARLLNENDYEFKLNIIGTGNEENELKELVDIYSLNSHVRFLGTMTPDEVRDNMKKVGIYIFTSNTKEGWGAVLNESMNSACAVVASHEIGSAPFLIQDGVNGYIYESGNVEMLYNKVVKLLEEPKRQAEVGNLAYQTIAEEWNAEEAALRLIKISEDILAHKNPIDLYKSGPCSRAEIVPEKW